MAIVWVDAVAKCQHVEISLPLVLVNSRYANETKRGEQLACVAVTLVAVRTLRLHALTGRVSGVQLAVAVAVANFASKVTCCACVNISICLGFLSMAIED